MTLLERLTLSLWRLRKGEPISTLNREARMPYPKFDEHLSRVQKFVEENVDDKSVELTARELEIMELAVRASIKQLDHHINASDEIVEAAPHRQFMPQQQNVHWGGGRRRR